MNMDILAVDTKHVSTYDFLQDGETEEELLNRANGYKQRNVILCKKNVRNYPYRDDFKTYLKEAQETEYKIMKWDEYEKLQKDFYINQPLKEVTEEEFNDMLNILPPLRWCTIDEIEMFCLKEMLTGTYTSQYARYKNKYYMKIVDVTDKATWINKYL